MSAPTRDQLIERNVRLAVRLGQLALRVSDDVEGLIGERFHREVFPPTTDPATLPPKVRAIATVVWTQAVIDAYRAAHPVTP